MTYKTKPYCDDPQHFPPKDLKPGTYTHICPKCGFEVLVTVPAKKQTKK